VALGRRRGLVILLGAALTITLSDQLAAHVIKPWVGRERPCSALTDVDLLIRCSGSPSFPSAHAANTFAGALYFSRFAPGLTIPLAVIAFIISYSRVYVGVHYPLDLIGGALLGMACATLVLAVMSRAKVGPRGRKPPPSLPAPPPPTDP
jgi:undecaprenyl-diphosphatase